MSVQIAFLAFTTATLFIRPRMPTRTVSDGSKFAALLFYSLVTMLFDGFTEVKAPTSTFILLALCDGCCICSYWWLVLALTSACPAKGLGIRLCEICYHCRVCGFCCWDMTDL